MERIRPILNHPHGDFKKSIELEHAGSSLEVSPGMNIQHALDFVATHNELETLVFKEGSYLLEYPLVLDQRHDGIRLTGNSENPESIVLDGQNKTQIVIIDGISSKQPVQFTINGITLQNGNSNERALRRNIANQRWTVPQTWGRYSAYANFDGAGVLILGKSFGEISNCIIRGCEARYCGAGISLQQYYGPGFTNEDDYLQPVYIREVQFANNKARDTGADIDLLPVSYAVIKDCLFEGSRSNTDYNKKRHGVITIFPESLAIITNNKFHLSDEQPVAIDYRRGAGAVQIAENQFLGGINPIADLTTNRLPRTLRRLMKMLQTHGKDNLKACVANFPNVRPGIYSLDKQAREAHSRLVRGHFGDDPYSVSTQ